GGKRHEELFQRAIARRDFKTKPVQTDGAVAAPLSAGDFGSEGQLKFLAGRTGPADVFVVEITMEGSLADFGVDLAVIFHLDPGLSGVVELLQSEVGNAFEHGKKPALDLAPKSFLLSVLIRTER